MKKILTFLTLIAAASILPTKSARAQNPQTWVVVCRNITGNERIGVFSVKADAEKRRKDHDEHCTHRTHIVDVLSKQEYDELIRVPRR